MSRSKYDMITILGATATGKTGVATHLAKAMGAEIISGDSRQVYRGMDLGTGKDIEEYTLDGYHVPFHLIDIVNAGEQYNVYRFQQDFKDAYEDICKRNKFPILCGGSGMYLEAVLKGYRLIQVPPNSERRKYLEQLTLSELVELLSRYKEVHNNSDIENTRRAIRAIEIEEYLKEHPDLDHDFPKINSLVVGIDFDREMRRDRISLRLKQRLEEGMIDEVKGLLEQGCTPDQLIYYGLEYKFLTEHVIGKLSYEEMFSRLEIAIHQFAKRQMTWYRKMEKDGFQIHWIKGELPMEEKISQILELKNQL